MQAQSLGDVGGSHGIGQVLMEAREEERLMCIIDTWKDNPAPDCGQTVALCNFTCCQCVTIIPQSGLYFFKVYFLSFCHVTVSFNCVNLNEVRISLNEMIRNVFMAIAAAAIHIQQNNKAK